MKIRSLLFAGMLGAAGTGVTAQQVGDVSVGLGLTNFGVALQGEYRLQPNLGARAMLMGGFSIEDEFEVEDSTVDGKAELGGFAVLADYYPLSNPWRVSGGLFLSNSEVTGEFTDGGLPYQGELTFENDVAPLITTGLAYPFGSGWSFSGDVGVIVSSLKVSSNSNDPVVQQDIADLNDDLSDIPVFPFIGFGVSYSY